MKTSIKQKWISALRSGKYRQGRGALRRGDKYCCLGVLCELAIQDGVKIELDVDNESRTTFDGSAGYPPVAVMDWADLSDNNPRIRPGGESDRTLAGINDEGASFETIADLIEKHL